MTQTNAKQDVRSTRRHLTRFERLSIAVETQGMDERTISAAYADPSRVRESTLRRIRSAAERLGLPTPPQPGEAVRA